jgi:DNA-binding LacI/PurR family transcriptional regulator
MLQPLPQPQLSPAARHDRPLLVVGSCAASLTTELARSGGSVIAFLCDEDALAWLDEETPWGAVFVTPPDPTIAVELYERGVPMLVCGRREGDRDRDRIMHNLSALGN